MVHLEAAAPEIFQQAGVRGEVEGQTIGVESLPGLAVPAVGGAVAVLAVSQQGVTGVGELGPDLMGAARLEAAFQQGELAQPLQHLVAGVGVLGVRLGGRVDRHFFAVGLAAAKVCFHKALVLRKAAVDHRLVGALHAVHRHLLGKADVGGVVLCHHQQAAGVLINAVDDAGTHHSADAGKAVFAMVKQGVNKGSVGISRRRMHNHSLRLIDHQKIIVLVNYIKGYVLGHSL